MHEMAPDIRLIKEGREEMIREVEANRLAKATLGRRGPLAAGFAAELKLDFIRLADVFRRTEKAGKGSS